MRVRARHLGTTADASVFYCLRRVSTQTTSAIMPVPVGAMPGGQHGPSTFDKRGFTSLATTKLFADGPQLRWVV